MSLISKDAMNKIKELDRKQIEEGQPTGFTTKELAKYLKSSRHYASDTLDKWFESGDVKFNGNRRIVRRDGKTGTVPVYQFVKDVNNENNT